MPTAKVTRLLTAALFAGAATVAPVVLASPTGAAEPPAQEIKRFKVELYVETMEFEPSVTDVL